MKGSHTNPWAVVSLMRDCRTMLTSALLMGGTVTATWAIADQKPETSPPGLRGILAPQTPGDLASDSQVFADLGPNWRQWSDELGSEVNALFQNGELPVEGQRKAIAALNGKLQVIRTAITDKNYRMIADPLVTLHERLARRVAFAEAALDTLQMDPETAKLLRLKPAVQNVQASLDNLKSALTKWKNGEAWLPYFGADKVAKAVSQSATTAESLQVLAAAVTALDPTEGMNAEQREFLQRQEFAALKVSVQDYLQVAKADYQPADAEKLRAELKNLIAAVEEYDQHGSSAAAGAAHQALNAIRGLSPDRGIRIADAMTPHYTNYNLRVIASESLLTRLAADDRVDVGPVDDFILGAKVDGEQTTKTTVSIDLKPGVDDARFDLTLNGVTESSTHGVTDEATIYTSGYHRFVARKGIIFDGDRFATHPAKIDVDPNNTTTGASTMYSGAPLLGGFARSVAVREARRKRSESESIAAQRLTDRVRPEFDSEVDKRFEKFNTDLDQKVDVPLKDLKLFPTQMSFRTTEDKLLISTSLMADAELAGGTPNTAVTSDTGAVVQLHETLMNNSLDRLNLGGRTMSDVELKQEIEQFISKLIGRDYTFPSKPEAAGDGEADKTEPGKPTTFIFPKTDALRVRVDEGTLYLTIQAGLKQGEGEEDIPTQRITVPLNFKIDGSNIVVERGTVAVAPVDPPESQVKQIARAGVMRRKVQGALPDRAVDRFFSVKREEGQKPVELSVAQIKAVGGWLSIVIE